MAKKSGKTLIIAEKPSVATDLARVLSKVPELGKFTKKKDYFESDNAYISSAIGHLVELKMPLTQERQKTALEHEVFASNSRTVRIAAY